MPATPEAAAVTDAYRLQLLRLRETTVRLVARPLTLINYNKNLGPQLARWVADSEPTLDLAQREAARLTDTYFDVYLNASGVTPDSAPVDVATVARPATELRSALRVAQVGLLWRLGRAGRIAAESYALAEAMRVTRRTVVAPAHDVLGQRMTEDTQVGGWIRVTGRNACGACLALSDGRVHRSETPMRRHDHCRCSPEPVIRNVHQRFVRPTGTETYDRMTEVEKAQLFAGRGGATKAAVVDRRGLGCLVHSTGDGVTEATLAAIS